MYLIFTYVIREVVNKKRFLSQVVLYSFNIIRNTLYDLSFYKIKQTPIQGTLLETKIPSNRFILFANMPYCGADE